MAETTGFQGRTFDVPRTGVPWHRSPEPSPVRSGRMLSSRNAKAFLSSSEARQMSESELERELHRRRQDLVRKLLQGHRDLAARKRLLVRPRTPAVSSARSRTSGSKATSKRPPARCRLWVCAPARSRRPMHRLDAALNLIADALVEMRRPTIATPPTAYALEATVVLDIIHVRSGDAACGAPVRRLIEGACRHLVRARWESTDGDTWLRCGGSRAGAGEPEP